MQKAQTVNFSRKTENIGLNHGWSYVVTTVGCGHAKKVFHIFLTWWLSGFCSWGNESLQGELQCKTNPNPRTVWTSWYRFIINISIGEDFLFYNSDSYKVTLKTFYTYKQLQLQSEYRNSHVDISGIYLLPLLCESWAHTVAIGPVAKPHIWLIFSFLEIDIIVWIINCNGVCDVKEIKTKVYCCKKNNNKHLLTIPPEPKTHEDFTSVPEKNLEIALQCHSN